MIIAKNRELLIPVSERYVGTAYDDNSTVRIFRVSRVNEDGVDRSNLDFYVILNYDDGSDPAAFGVVKSVTDEYIILEWDVSEDVTKHSDYFYLWVRGFDYTGTIRWSSYPGVFYVADSGKEPTGLSDLEQRISEEDRLLRLAKLYKSQPMTAATVADMKDRERIYVYVGNEPGYTYGNWYFWDGSAWVSGGDYNAVAVQTDKDLIAPDVAADSAAVGDKIRVIGGKRHVLKEAVPGSTLEGYEYCSFSGGANFAGHEIYSFRAAKGHYTLENDYGTCVFYERTAADEFERLPINLNLDQSAYGELRQAHLSVGRDGTRLYISGFTSFKERGGNHYGVICVFNEQLDHIGTIITEGAAFYGNTLETPDGYLLHTEYSDMKANIYRSSTPIANADYSTITMEKVATVVHPEGYDCSEQAIGYYRDRLVMVTRVQDGHAACYSYTYDLEGASGWHTFMSIGYIMCAPEIPPYSTGRYLVCAGSIINATITGNGSRRMPYIFLLDLVSSDTNAFVMGALIDDPTTWGTEHSVGYGGYTTLVKIDESRYGVMYYNDVSYQNDTIVGLYFKIVNINSDLSISYEPMENYLPEIKRFTPRQATIYNNSLLAWIKAVLNAPVKSFEFVIDTQAADLTDIPDEAKTNNLIKGHAFRRFDFYFVRLDWYKGPTGPRSASIQFSASASGTWCVDSLYEDVTVEVTAEAQSAQYIPLPYKSGYYISSISVISTSDSKSFLLSPPYTIGTSAYVRLYALGDGAATVTFRCYYSPSI